MKMRDKKLILEHLNYLNSLLSEEHRIDMSDLKETKKSIREFYNKLEYQLMLYRNEYMKQNSEEITFETIKYPDPPKRNKNLLPDISGNYTHWYQVFRKMIDEDKK